MTHLTLDGTGPIAEVLAESGHDFESRTAQIEYQEFVQDCLENNMPGFADAETGVGKTLGYLAALFESAFLNPKHKNAKPIVVISTNTVALQKQIAGSEVPIVVKAVKGAGGKNLTACVRVGKSQVIDIELLKANLEEYGSKQQTALASKVLNWVNKKIDIGELPLISELFADLAHEIDGVPPWLNKDIIGLKSDTKGRSSKTLEIYEDQVSKAYDADVLIVNHHLLGLHMMRPFLWETERPAYIVVDEADRLPETMENLGRSQVPFHVVSSILKDDAASRLAVEGQKYLAELTELTQKNMDNAWVSENGGILNISSVSAKDRGKIEIASGHLAGILRGIADQNDKKQSGIEKEKTADLRRYADGVEKAARSIEVGDYGNTLIYFTPIRKYSGLAIIGAGAGRMIARRLWNTDLVNTQGLIFTSATLSTLAFNSSVSKISALRPFAGSCGFDPSKIEEKQCCIIAPEDFGEMDFVRPSLNAPDAFSGNDDDTPIYGTETIPYWKNTILKAAAEKGRVLVLVPSYRDVMALSDLDEEIGKRLIAQERGMKTEAATKAFLSMNDSVWVSSSVWEGLSLPGAIQHIVIPRLPIRPATLHDQLLEQYIIEKTGSMGKAQSATFAKKISEARKRFRQGIGRGVRRKSDKVKIWICDPRWPLTAEEMTEHFIDQPRKWSTTFLNAIPGRFVKNVAKSPRFEG